MQYHKATKNLKTGREIRAWECLPQHKFQTVRTLFKGKLIRMIMQLLAILGVKIF